MNDAQNAVDDAERERGCAAQERRAVRLQRATERKAKVEKEMAERHAAFSLESARVEEMLKAHDEVRASAARGSDACREWMRLDPAERV